MPNKHIAIEMFITHSSSYCLYLQLERCKAEQCGIINYTATVYFFSLPAMEQGNDWNTNQIKPKSMELIKPTQGP